MAVYKFAAPGLEEAELSYRRLVIWRYEKFFRLARELHNKGANNLFISLRSIACGQAAHSQRSATSGSTFVARRAGIQHASSATKVSISVITMNVSGSVGLIP
jgi:hypothetical protein